MSNRLILKNVRLSFPKVFEPESFQDGPLRYSTMILIDKADTATVAELRKAEANAAEEGRNKFGAKWKPSGSIIHDADEDGTADDYPERAGHLYLTVGTNASANFPKPGVVDKSGQTIIDPSEVYSGVYAHVSVSPYAYNNTLKKGVSFGLNNLMILGHGERLSGGPSAETEFADFAETGDTGDLL